MEQLGKPVADFSLEAAGGSTFRLADQRGKKLVLYFCPKDNTRGCTQQTRFPFELPSHRDEKVWRQFGVMKEKTLYGRKVRGIERSTFVLDRDGRLLREWRGVKVPGHVEEVLNFAKAL